MKYWNILDLGHIWKSRLENMNEVGRNWRSKYCSCHPTVPTALAKALSCMASQGHHNAAIYAFPMTFPPSPSSNEHTFLTAHHSLFHHFCFKTQIFNLVCVSWKQKPLVRNETCHLGETQTVLCLHFKELKEIKRTEKVKERETLVGLQCALRSYKWKSLPPTISNEEKLFLRSVPVCLKPA